MKFLSSLKAWRKRGKTQIVRRGKQVVVLNDNPKLKAKQGGKK